MQRQRYINWLKSTGRSREAKIGTVSGGKKEANCPAKENLGYAATFVIQAAVLAPSLSLGSDVQWQERTVHVQYTVFHGKYRRQDTS